MTKDQLNRVAEAIVSNSQVHDSYGAQSALMPIMNAGLTELAHQRMGAISRRLAGCHERRNC
jgi:hypothetical protein